MNNNMINRREALSALGGFIASGALLGSCKAGRAEGQTGLGLVIYVLGIRRHMLKQTNTKHDLFEPLAFLDYSHSLGAGGVQVELREMSPDQCEQLRAKANEYGMFVEGIVRSPFENDDIKRFETDIETAARVGASAVRTIIIPGRRYEYFKSRDEFDQFVTRGENALLRARPIVEKFEVPLAVENHKDQRLEQRIKLLQKLDSPMIGACVDTGNSFALLEDPMTVVEALAPFAITVHIKDQAVQPCRDGFLLADVALGDGFLDLKRMVEMLQKAKPGIHFNLETITRDPLRVPCLAESYWPTFENVSGSDLARTLRIVRDQAADKLLQVTTLSLDKQVETETNIVNRSLEYAQRTLLL